MKKLEKPEIHHIEESKCENQNDQIKQVIGDLNKWNLAVVQGKNQQENLERTKKASNLIHAEQNDQYIKELLAKDYAEMRKEEVGNVFECAVCGDTFDEVENEAYTLTGCEHYFHSDCLWDYFES